MVQWIIACNTKDYNVVGAFEKLDTIDWKQSTNVEVGDEVYIYVGKPIQAISYKCKVLATNLKDDLIDDLEFVLDDSNFGNYGRYMRLKLVSTYNDSKLGYQVLLENGLKTLQGPSKVSAELATYLSSVVSTIDEQVVSSEDIEMESLISKEKSAVIENFIKQFQKKLPEFMAKEKEVENLRIKFVNDYNMNKIMNMTKEEYVVGLGSKDSFCYRLETELKEFGNIYGSTSMKFGLYYGKSGDDSEEKYRFSKKYGSTVDEVLEELKKQIVFLRMDGEKKDYEAIRKCELPPLIRGKILSVFFPEVYLCIFAEEHLDYFLKKIGIHIKDNDDVLVKQQKLAEWKQKRPEMKDWNNHTFSTFLYWAFGKPLEAQKSSKEIQEEKDKEYPRDYVSKIGITISQWKELLQNPEVFTQADIDFLKRIYKFKNHATTCYDLGIQDGVSPTSYISPVVALAKRIADATGIEPIKDGDRTIWWRIPFWGRYREDTRFEWKIRPKLAKAMALIFSELTIEANAEIELKEDEQLISALKEANVVCLEKFVHSGEPREKATPIYVAGHKTYPRDRLVAINALSHANYLCEIDEKHPTFIRRNSEKTYTEPHHLVPMAFSDNFSVSLDVEENIVSLCSNCHNQIHYGKDANLLIERLYDERKAALSSVGITISIEQLLSMYNF